MNEAMGTRYLSDGLTSAGNSCSDKLELALRFGFIDDSTAADAAFLPRLVTNDQKKGTNLLAVIKSQLLACDRFDICVAFVAKSGLQPLVEVLSELRRRGTKGRFLTSTYLNFNNPDTLKKLIEYDNMEVRVYEGNLHAKCYLFDRDSTSTIIVGSSNLTQMALTCNQEWNVLFHSLDKGGMLHSLRKQFDELWEDGNTVALTNDWLAEYDRCWRVGASDRRGRPGSFKSGTAEKRVRDRIQPNEMQTHALQALVKLHEREEPRALIVSATGTGKTYLSAFDIASFKPEHMLFLAHRQRILKASKESFERVLGDSYPCEIYELGKGYEDCRCLFAMFSTVARHLDEFDPRAFDYIVIDEAHRAGSPGYRRILDYFKPRFCLGMTATPRRTDGIDVCALFNHVIAFQITLQDALANDMLVPFHYFGIADLAIDDRTVDDLTLFGRLASEERVRHITAKIEEYSVSREGRRGLIFCNRNDEAAELSRLFNGLGYRTCALSGEDSDEARNQAIEALEEGRLEYIFSVDILNEGVDIPSLNQIILLRRTESAVVFVQQIGRGLRKHEGKEFTLILDFIGNYQKNFLVPVALTGDRTYNKDTLRVIVKEGSSFIPGCSTISFDRVSKARIYESIDGGDFNRANLLKEEYKELKSMLGRIPRLCEFDANESIDPVRLFNKYGSYHAFLSRCDPEYGITFSEAQELMLKFVSKKLGCGKSRGELLLLREVIERFDPSTGWHQRGSHNDGECRFDRSVLGYLSGSFSAPKGFVQMIAIDNDSYVPTRALLEALGDERFRVQLLEVVDFGLERNRRLFSSTYRETSLVLDAKYTYEEVCHLLHWEKNVNGQNIGGYKYDERTNTFPVFINYEKDPDISKTTQYEDRFVSDRELIAISKSPRTLDSPEIERLRRCPENGMKPYLFVRKNKNDGDGSKEFYFLGEMYPTGRFEQIIMPGTTSSAVEITYLLEDAVRPDLFDYLTSNIDAPEGHWQTA